MRAVEYFKYMGFSSIYEGPRSTGKNEGVFKKHALSLAEGARPALS